MWLAILDFESRIDCTDVTSMLCGVLKEDVAAALTSGAPNFQFTFSFLEGKIDEGPSTSDHMP
jgi:hypothetical protein